MYSSGPKCLLWRCTKGQIGKGNSTRVDDMLDNIEVLPQYQQPNNKYLQVYAFNKRSLRNNALCFDAKILSICTILERPNNIPFSLQAPKCYISVRCPHTTTTPWKETFLFLNVCNYIGKHFSETVWIVMCCNIGRVLSAWGVGG